MKYHSLFFKIFLIFFVILFCSVSEAAMLVNGAGKGYNDAQPGPSGDFPNSSRHNSEIEYYIIIGAGHYLNANADVQKLLNALEMQDIQYFDFRETLVLVDSALNHMNNAKSTYEDLIRKAKATAYDERVLDILEDFDYYRFMQKYHLNRTVFGMVRRYLEEGKITESIEYTYSNFLNIISLLRNIKVELSNQQMPEISLFWQLNETIVHNSLFGSYVARVFFAIH